MTFSGFSPAAVDLLSDVAFKLDDGVTPAPHQFVWLRVTPSSDSPTE
nr:hypothetical protein [Pseudarthrobacter psychrotolerans]